MKNYYQRYNDLAKLPPIELSQIHQTRSQHREQLDELENLYKYVVQIMARKECPV